MFGAAGRELILVERTEKTLEKGIHETLLAPDRAQGIGMGDWEWSRDCVEVRFTVSSYAKLYRQLA
jgi:hypothetical protein